MDGTTSLIVSDVGNATTAPDGALRDLCHDLLEAVRGRAGTFVVTGAAATGKSRSAEQIARQLAVSGWRVVTGYAAGRDFTALLTMLSAALETPPGPDLLLARVRASIEEQHRAGHPVAVIIDDAHQIDGILPWLPALRETETGAPGDLRVLLFGRPELDALLDRLTEVSHDIVFRRALCALPAETHQIAPKVAVEIEIEGVVVRVRNGADLRTVATVLEALSPAGDRISRRLAGDRDDASARPPQAQTWGCPAGD